MSKYAKTSTVIFSINLTKIRVSKGLWYRIFPHWFSINRKITRLVPRLITYSHFEYDIKFAKILGHSSVFGPPPPDLILRILENNCTYIPSTGTYIFEHHVTFRYCTVFVSACRVCEGLFKFTCS
jgi:hypothetical protein